VICRSASTSLLEMVRTSQTKSKRLARRQARPVHT
jgi:hypothetical protein